MFFLLSIVKNKKFKIFIIISVIFLFLLSFPYKNVTADSGWDTDYSESWSSNSWGSSSYGSSWRNNSYGGSSISNYSSIPGFEY